MLPYNQLQNSEGQKPKNETLGDKENLAVIRSDLGCL